MLYFTRTAGEQLECEFVRVAGITNLVCVEFFWKIAPRQFIYALLCVSVQIVNRFAYDRKLGGYLI